MPTPDPTDVAAYEERLAKMTIVTPDRLSGRIKLSTYHPAWPALYEREAARVLGALGRRVIRLEHVGSTSVAGLASKPIIDIVLEVPDSSDEQAYVYALQAAGYVLQIREPDWFLHRMFRGPEFSVNLHVFSAGCEETTRMLRFRDRLRNNSDDRDLYERAKRELASRDWTYGQQYADAKTDVVASILARATPSGY
jgi:GrpB-like predicted nucleotidyltransferase (UPF0157 family)